MIRHLTLWFFKGDVGLPKCTQKGNIRNMFIHLQIKHSNHTVHIFIFNCLTPYCVHLSGWQKSSCYRRLHRQLHSPGQQGPLTSGTQSICGREQPLQVPCGGGRPSPRHLLQRVCQRLQQGPHQQMLKDHHQEDARIWYVDCVCLLRIVIQELTPHLVRFVSPRQNVLKLILKSPRFFPFGDNLTKFRCRI